MKRSLFTSVVVKGKSVLRPFLTCLHNVANYPKKKAQKTNVFGSCIEHRRCNKTEKIIEDHQNTLFVANRSLSSEC